MVRFCRESLLLIIAVNLIFLYESAFLCNAAVVPQHDVNDRVFTSTEKLALELFKERVLPILTEDFMKTNFYLIRWLRARNMDVAEAEYMLRQNLRWRDEHNMREITYENFSDVQRILPAMTDGHDKMKRPVVAISLGAWDFSAAAMNGNLARAHRYYYYLFENTMHDILEAEAAGMQITRAVVLVDLDRLNLLSPSAMSIILRMQTTLEAFYPGFWEEIIMINAPTGSNMLWMSIQPILSPQTKEQFKIFDTNRAKWMPYLDQRIDRDQRYPNFGGSREFKM